MQKHIWVSRSSKNSSRATFKPSRISLAMDSSWTCLSSHFLIFFFGMIRHDVNSQLLCLFRISRFCSTSSILSFCRSGKDQEISVHLSSSRCHDDNSRIITKCKFWILVNRKNKVEIMSDSHSRGFGQWYKSITFD